MSDNQTAVSRRAWQTFIGTNSKEIIGSGLIEASRIRRLKSGHILIQQDDTARSVYLVLSGSFKAVWFTRNGHEIWLSDILSGEIVGEFAAFSDGIRSSTVVTCDPSSCIEVPIDDFRSALASSNALTMKIASILSNRVQATSQQVVALVGLPLAARLHAELQRIGTRESADVESVIVNQPPTVSELAEKIHASREATSRALSALQKRGLVFRKKGHLQIIVPDYV